MADLATPMSIRVAATLSLVERAGSVGATAEQLASQTGTATPAIRCLLDHLVTIGVFDFGDWNDDMAAAPAPLEVRHREVNVRGIRGGIGTAEVEDCDAVVARES
jgi:hypothetical protein